jgi:non-heme chloroperoxidase
MRDAIDMHYIGNYFPQGISKIVFIVAAAPPSFTKREEFPYGRKKSVCDDLILQSLQNRL